MNEEKKFQRSIRKEFICNDCGVCQRYSKVPNFCSNCGSQNIVQNSAVAVRHAKELITKMNVMIPEIEAAYNLYLEKFIEFENIRRVVVGYAKRGHITTDEVPILKRKRVIDALYEYRAKRKEGT